MIDSAIVSDNEVVISKMENTKGVWQMSKTIENIIKNKIIAIERALETNDQEFIRQWHGNRSYAEIDLEELKVRLNSFQYGKGSCQKTAHTNKTGGVNIGQ